MYVWSGHVLWIDVDLIFLDMITPINRSEGYKLRRATLWRLLPPGAALLRHRAVRKCPQQGVTAKLKHALASTIEGFLVFMLGFLWPSFP